MVPRIVYFNYWYNGTQTTTLKIYGRNVVVTARNPMSVNTGETLNPLFISARCIKRLKWLKFF